MIADVEGMVPYDALVEETLAFGLLPAVTPQLKSIIVGGAVSGLGIESSSFRYGLVHETVEEMEVLLGDGRAWPVEYFDRIAEPCDQGDQDFLDGMVLSGGEMYMSEGPLSEAAPHVSDYGSQPRDAFGDGIRIGFGVRALISG